jgi:hypothetical protein
VSSFRSMKSTDEDALVANRVGDDVLEALVV